MKTVTVIQEFYRTQRFLKCENALNECMHSLCISLIILFKVCQRLRMMSVGSLKKQPFNKWLNLNKDVICRKKHGSIILQYSEGQAGLIIQPVIASIYCSFSLQPQ